MATCVGSEFTVNENGQLELNTGCGLTKDGNQLSVNARPESDWPYGCDIESGSQLYCTGDGELRGPPEPQSRTGVTSASETWETGVQAGVGGTQRGRTVEFTIDNPSDCQCFVVHLQFGVGGQWINEPGGRGILSYFRDIPGGFAGEEGPIPITGHGVSTPAAVQNTGAENPSAVADHTHPLPQNVDWHFEATERDFTLTIAPGESATIRMAPAILNGPPAPLSSRVGPTGPVTVYQLAGSIRFWGYTSNGAGRVDANGQVVEECLTLADNFSPNT